MICYRQERRGSLLIKYIRYNRVERKQIATSADENGDSEGRSITCNPGFKVKTMDRDGLETRGNRHRTGRRERGVRFKGRSSRLFDSCFVRFNHRPSFFYINFTFDLLPSRVQT